MIINVKPEQEQSMIGLCKFCGAKIYWKKEKNNPPRSYNKANGNAHNPECRPNEILAHPAYKALNPAMTTAGIS